MLGIVAARPIALRALLRDVPRSLAALSREHPHGWGIASSDQSGWSLHKNDSCAASCASYDRLATTVTSSLAIAHVRQKTVGGTSLTNTHPFRRGRFVLAHNGTVSDVEALVRRCSARRLAEIEGETDSERLFAFVASRVDESTDVETGVAQAVRELHRVRNVGAVSFLFSDGEHLFAHRWGRTLYLLLRSPEGEKTARRARSVTIASEKLTDEPWQEVAEGALLAIGVGERPVVRTVSLD
jgi:glutamine amidotransferase